MSEPFRVQVCRGRHGKGGPSHGPLHGIFRQVRDVWEISRLVLTVALGVRSSVDFGNCYYKRTAADIFIRSAADREDPADGVKKELRVLVVLFCFAVIPERVYICSANRSITYTTSAAHTTAVNTLSWYDRIFFCSLRSFAPCT